VAKRQETHARPGIAGLVLTQKFLVVGSLKDQAIDDAMRFVDVMKGAIPKAPREWIIFFPRDVIVSFIQQFLRAVKATGASQLCVDRRMIIQILTIVNRSPLDFVDGFVDLVNGVLLFFVHVMGGSQILQVSTGVSQISERVEVCWMPSWRVGKAHGSAHSENQNE
jgi:hypothetical protein